MAPRIDLDTMLTRLADRPAAPSSDYDLNRDVTLPAGMDNWFMPDFDDGEWLGFRAPEVEAVIDALSARLARARPGDPADRETRMGALVSRAQRDDDDRDRRRNRPEHDQRGQRRARHIRQRQRHRRPADHHRSVRCGHVERR